MECVCAQTAPRFVLSSERGLGEWSQKSIDKQKSNLKRERGGGGGAEREREREREEGGRGGQRERERERRGEGGAERERERGGGGYDRAHYLDINQAYSIASKS